MGNMKLKISIGAFVLAVFGFTSSIQAQVAYRFRNFDINNGLSQSSVTAIVQDNIGTLWVGTQDGLNRFDGQGFEVFTSDDTPGLESSYIHSGLKDKSGILWFGTSVGLTSYNPRIDKFSSIKKAFHGAISVESLTQDASQTIWIGTATMGLAYLDNNQIKLSDVKLPSKRIHYLKAIANYSLIVATEDKGVFLVNTERNTVTKIDSQGNDLLVNDAEKLDDKQLLFATNKGLWKYNIESQKPTPFLTQIEAEFGIVEFAAVYVKSPHEIYIASVGNGLLTAIQDKGEYQIIQSKQDFFQKNALLFNELTKLYSDRNGALWIGSQRGLSCFDPKNEGFLGVGPSGNLTQGLPSESVWGFAETTDGKNLFVATDIALSKLDREKGKFEQFYFSKGSDNAEKNIISIYLVSDERILVGANDGLYDFVQNGSAYSFQKIPFKGIDNATDFQRIYKILPYKEHRYFLATKGGVLLYNDLDKSFLPFVNNPKKPQTTIGAGLCRVVYKGLDGTFYFATSTGGLYQLKEKNGNLEIVPHKFHTQILAATKDNVASLLQTSKRDLWIGTSGSGLLKLDLSTGKIKTYTRKNGLPNNFVYGILPDAHGNLWLSTNKGLCRLNIVSGLCANYAEVNGLMSNEFNTGAYFKAQNGELYFGGIAGYNFFNPELLDEDLDQVYVTFAKIRFEDNWIVPGKNALIKTTLPYISKLEIPYDKHSFTLKFITSDLLNRNLYQYKYQLVGSDEGDVYLGSSDEIHFSSLSPGNYTLKVYVRRLDGEWMESPVALGLEIAAPFWWKWWFWLIVLFISTLLIYWFVHNRIDQARREQIRLEMKIVERTKEIRAQNMKIEYQKKVIEEEKEKVEQQRHLLEIEKDKTDRLLRNIIPESTAEELKTKGKASARAYKTVSVLFTDFVGFTKIAEGLKPTELVNKLDVYFSRFDEIIVKNNLEKIKTIGDAYMCAGGVPVRNNTNPIDAVLAALQIQDYMNSLKNDAIAKNEEYWELRLGINTGEVTAGVIGSERLAYDIWGATVNQAQRMEMMGEPGRVTVSGSTFKLIEPYFECTYRGKVKSKSQGLIEMFTVERIKPELSVDEEGLYPNERFHQIVNLHLYSSINYYKAERHIMKVLEKGLSPKLHYHSIEHTKDVVRAVERYALMEGVTDEGLFLLKSAATYHDAGFVENYEKNEPIGARMAGEILPKYGYSDQHIQLIEELIFVTQIPHKPKNKLEEIICDADLDYLGRDDFHEIADRLRKELREYGKIDSDRKWDEMQVAFLNMHKYFTATAIASRQAKKMQNLKEVMERLERNEYKD